MKKKSRSCSGPGSRWGGRPWLISWAAVVIIDFAAWRKIWVRRTTGAAPESIRSSNGLPAPIGGSWSASPTKTMWVVSASPSSSTSARRRFSIEDSSTTTSSTGSGRPGPKPGSPPGTHSSIRWIVCASCPVVSCSRRAARPVGAQSAILAPAFSAAMTISLVQRVLPTPGPPVRTEMRDPKAPRTAAHCSSVSSSSGSLSPGSWSRNGGRRQPARQRRRHRALALQGQLAVDAPVLVDQPARVGQHRRVGDEADQPRRALGELLHRQEAVAALFGLAQDVDGGRLGAFVGLRRHVGGERDLVGAGEADALDLGQPVGVLVQDRGRALAVAGVDRRRQVGEAVRGELDVELAHGAALVPGGGRRRGLVDADALQRLEGPLRVGGDHLQDLVAVRLDQLLGAPLADVAEAREVGDLPLAVGRVERQGALGAQLAAVARVGLPLAADFGALAGAEVGDRPDQRETVAAARLLHLEHGVAIVLGAEDHAEHLDRAGVGSGVGVEQTGGAHHLSKLRGGEADRSGVRVGAMASWGEIETVAPDLARLARGLLEAHVHKTLATLRADGSPRISGLEAKFIEGDLWFGSMPGSRKGADLARDPRFALHSGSIDPPGWQGDAKLSGIAEEIVDPGRKVEIFKAMGAEGRVGRLAALPRRRARGRGDAADRGGRRTDDRLLERVGRRALDHAQMTDGAEGGAKGAPDERAPDDLPWVDEHASEIDAPASVVWPALLRTVERMAAGGAAPRYARAVGCADTEAGGPRPLEVGSTVPGFHVAELAPERSLTLAGSHRFSDYALVFRARTAGRSTDPAGRRDPRRVPGVRGPRLPGGGDRHADARPRRAPGAARGGAPGRARAPMSAPAAAPRPLRRLPPPAARPQHPRLGLLALRALPRRPRIPALPAAPGPPLPRLRADGGPGRGWG